VTRENCSAQVTLATGNTSPHLPGKQFGLALIDCSRLLSTKIQSRPGKKNNGYNV